LAGGGGRWGWVGVDALLFTHSASIKRRHPMMKGWMRERGTGAMVYSRCAITLALAVTVRHLDTRVEVFPQVLCVDT